MTQHEKTILAQAERIAKLEAQLTTLQGAHTRAIRESLELYKQLSGLNHIVDHTLTGRLRTENKGVLWP